MQINELFAAEELSDLYATPDEWNQQQNLGFDFADSWEFVPAPELEGEGINSAYIARTAAETGLLIASSTGWNYYPADCGLWKSIDLFSEAGQHLLEELGFLQN